MKLASPARAIAWEIWCRNRKIFQVIAVILCTGGLTSFILGPRHSQARLMESLAYVGLGAMLLLGFGAFHFTEGRKQAGFGCFPARLFRLPAPTPLLVGLPMVMGALTILAIYLGSVFLIFRPIDVHPPVTWPCLYLVFGLTQFQMIVWSFPEHRRLKLVLLSVAGTMVLMGWMFFLPSVVEGTLSDWGFTGDTRLVTSTILGGLALAVPAAFVVSLHRVGLQRHGSNGGKRYLAAVWERVWSQRRACRSPGAFRNTSAALFWHEWRQTGWILPACTAVPVAMIWAATAFSEPVSPQASKGVLIGLLLTPVILAIIIGCGFGKADFWESSLKLNSYHAVRPLIAGEWVVARMKVAATSVVVCWAVVIPSMAVWFIQLGDFRAFDNELEVLRFYYSPGERVILLCGGLCTLVLLSWRFLIGGMATGLSGRRPWFYTRNLLTILPLVVFLAYLITGGSEPGRDSRLHLLWPWIAWAPVILGVAVAVKSVVALEAWRRVVRDSLLSQRLVLSYFACWIVASFLPAYLVLTAVQHADWLRWTLLLGSLLWVPLCGPALAMLALSMNRRSA